MGVVVEVEARLPHCDPDLNENNYIYSESVVQLSMGLVMGVHPMSFLVRRALQPGYGVLPHQLLSFALGTV